MPQAPAGQRCTLMFGEALRRMRSRGPSRISALYSARADAQSFIVEPLVARNHVLHARFAQAQQAPLFRARSVDCTRPPELHPLVFIYRSPTVKTEFHLHRQLIGFGWPGVQWHRVSAAGLARQSTISKEV